LRGGIAVSGIEVSEAALAVPRFSLGDEYAKAKLRGERGDEKRYFLKIRKNEIEEK
jgi:hypothetical protein